MKINRSGEYPIQCRTGVQESDIQAVRELTIAPEIARLKKTFGTPRFVSIEQAKITTTSYRRHEGCPTIVKRAQALASAMEEIEISIDPEEPIVGNRTCGIRAGVISPEAGIGWVGEELESLPTRP